MLGLMVSPWGLFDKSEQVLFCTKEAKMSSRIFGVFLSPFSVFPVEEFKRFRRKPELLLLTGVKIVLLKVWRTVLDLHKGGGVEGI